MIGNIVSIFKNMNNIVLIFNGRLNEESPSADDLIEQVHKLAQDSENIRFYVPHAQQRMRERNIGIRQKIEVLRAGDHASGPVQDQYGDWRIKLRRMVAGKRVQVVVAVKKNLFRSYHRYMKKFMNTTHNLYHYLESGLDNIYLLNGFKYIDSAHGKQITIKDIDGLHKAIGSVLIKDKKIYLAKKLDSFVMKCLCRNQL